jgi:maltooligosyltrehalose trehalohydrolase
MNGIPDIMAPRIAVPLSQPRLPVGAELVASETRFRVWARKRRSVVLVLESRDGKQQQLDLVPESDGYFSLSVPRALPGTRYSYRLDGEGYAYPDPASRFQPEGPHGPSEVIDPDSFHWTDHDWKGVQLAGQVLYEIHVGTFTTEGTWSSALRELPLLKELGVTCIEVMPVAEFPGKFGWGYDGVSLFAPSHLYGQPDAFRQFVNTAHHLGLGVILDVVYNHVGPDGNYLGAFSSDYFTDRYENEWGDSLNFDGPHCASVREFFIANAGYWIDEYHLDGLRLDATQSIFDGSKVHIMSEMEQRVRQAAKGRKTIIVAENECQHSKLVRPKEQGGCGLDALWNDDLHHTARVAATGSREAYYYDYKGSPQEFISALKWGYLYQGQRYAWQKARRGQPALDLSPVAFVNYLQNHDQVANSAGGLRLQALTTPGRYRALTTLFLLSPGTPMLFQGQEFAASAPFCYFADHKPELAQQVKKGRAEFLAQFPSLADEKTRARLPAPEDPATFTRCKLDLGERQTNSSILQLHKDLLRLRRSDPAFSRQRRGEMDGAVIGPEAFCLRFLTPDAPRLIVVNLGCALDLGSVPEPLMAPPEGCRWRVLFSSEDPDYGGVGVVELEQETVGWILPAHSAHVLVPARSEVP